MPLTLSESPEVRSRQGAPIEIQAATVEARSRIRSNVDGRVPGLARRRQANRPSIDIVEEWGLQSFPASDPPTNW